MGIDAAEPTPAVRAGGAPALSPKAADVLEALAEMPERVWSRDALLERVWPRVIVGEEVLTHAIAEVRAGLGDDFRAPHIIETVYKRGYRLKCAVKRARDPQDEDERSRRES